jgi:hypothetical protein
MAKTISTRIKNKVDTLAKWQAYTGTLLNGEIAVVRVPTGETYTNPVTGVAEPVVELLMKVGDGSSTFASLPWMSAKASDVYNWAKKGTAEEIPVTVNGTASTLGAYLTKVDTNASNISSVSTKVDVTKVSTAISSAINALDSTSTGSGNFVKAVTQTNGKVAVTMGTIAESELPSISTDKVYLAGAASTTLTTKLGTMDAAIEANTNKLAGHTDAAINTLINNKINALDVSEPSASGTSTSFIKTAKQENGKIVVTKANLPTASSSVAGIAKLGANGGAATYASVFGTDGKGGINKQVTDNTSDIANLKTAVAGGVHFRGTVSAEPSASTTTVGNVTIAAGDVVIYDGKEYICTAVTSGAPSWEQLGDVTRIGNLETKINGLDVSTTNAVATTHKFVSQVTQTDGKVAVTYTQPTSADVSHDGSTVKVALENLAANKANVSDVYTKTETGTQISNAIAALDVSEPTASGTSTSFIATAKQADGKIVVTKKNLPTATAGASGAAGTTGIVALIDSTSSTSTTTAATPNSVKTAYALAAKAEADAAAAAQAAAHDHSAYVNQKAFSNIKVGSTTVAADTTTDTVEFAGSNITITPDATSDKITFTVAKADADGETGIVTLEDSIVNQSKTAATSKAVYSVNTKAADAQTRVGAVEANYLRVDSNNKLVQYAAGTENEIIIDCGGAD